MVGKKTLRSFHTPLVFTTGTSSSCDSPDSDHFQQTQLDFISRVVYDALIASRCGAKIIRRIIGIAHVADMEGIQDINMKAKCEREALEMGMRLLERQIYVHNFCSIEYGIGSPAEINQ